MPRSSIRWGEYRITRVPDMMPQRGAIELQVNCSRQRSARFLIQGFGNYVCGGIVAGEIGFKGENVHRHGRIDCPSDRYFGGQIRAGQCPAGYLLNDAK
jgi:hypothetical protein